MIVVLESRNRIVKGSIHCKESRFIVSYKCVIKGQSVTSIPFHFRKNGMTIRLDEDWGYFVKRNHKYPNLIDTILRYSTL